MLEYDDQSEGDDEAVYGFVQGELKQAALQRETYQSHCQGGKHEADEKVSTTFNRDKCDIPAKHQQFAVCEHDEPGQAEYQRDPDGDERKDTCDRQAIDHLLQENVHVSQSLALFRKAVTAPLGAFFAARLLPRRLRRTRRWLGGILSPGCARRWSVGVAERMGRLSPP